MRHHRRISSPGTPTTLERLEKMHPHLLVTYIGVFGVCMIFFFLFVIYGHSFVKLPEGVAYKMPKAFVISTLSIMLSSFFLYRSKVAFGEDQVKKSAHDLGGAFFFGSLFIFLQVIGWQQLYQGGTMLSPEYAAGSFLYLLPGVHLLHVVGGLLYIGWQWVRCLRDGADPVKVLIMVTNPYEKIKIQMIGIYWHAIGLLWVVMFFLFFFSI